MTRPIDLGRLIPLSKVPELPCLPDGRRGRRIHVATIRRWASRGVGGVRLRVTRVGGMTCTTEGWLHAFFDAVSAQQQPSPDAPAGRTADPAQVEAELDAAGL